LRIALYLSAGSNIKCRRLSGLAFEPKWHRLMGLAMASNVRWGNILISLFDRAIGFPQEPVALRKTRREAQVFGCCTFKQWLSSLRVLLDPVPRFKADAYRDPTLGSSDHRLPPLYKPETRKNDQDFSFRCPSDSCACKSRSRGNMNSSSTQANFFTIYGAQACAT